MRGSLPLRSSLVLLALLGLAAAPSLAGDPGSVLVYGPSLIGALGPEFVPLTEADAATLAGYTPVVVDEAGWLAMTTPDFAAFDAIVIGDGGCSDPSGFDLSAVDLNKAVWSPAVTGNVLVHTFNATATLNGKVPVGDPLQMMVEGIGYAGAGQGTGLYFANGCRAYLLTIASSPEISSFEIAPLSELGVFTLASGPVEFVTIVAPLHPAMTSSSDISLSLWEPSAWASFVPPLFEGPSFLPPGFEPIAVTGALVEIVSPVAIARDGGMLFEEHFLSDLGQTGSQDGGGLDSIWYWEGFCAANSLPRPSGLEGGVPGGAARFGVPMSVEGPGSPHCSDYGHVAEIVETDCCVPNGGLGCDDPTCEATVCGVDPVCCNFGWDIACAAAANNFCDACNVDCGPGDLEVLVSDPIDPISCYTGLEGGSATAHARLSFNYLLDYEEEPPFDEARVQVTFGLSPSLEGPVSLELADNGPDGGLVNNAGAAWQAASFVFPLPDPMIEAPVGVLPFRLEFIVGLLDGCNNRGAGFYVDDVVVECSGPPPIFEDGFESGDTTAWSNTVP